MGYEMLVLGGKNGASGKRDLYVNGGRWLVTLNECLKEIVINPRKQKLTIVLLNNDGYSSHREALSSFSGK